MRTLMILALLLGASTAAAQIDCAQCAAQCTQGKTAESKYPDDLRPEELSKSIKHRDPDAQAAFDEGQRRDPSFGGRDVVGAVKSYKRAVKLDPKNPQYRNYLAASLMRAGKYSEAVYNLKQAVEIVPSSAKYRVNLGYAYHKLNSEPRALVNYMRALMLDSGNVRARLFAGFAMERLGLKEDAELEFKRVLLQQPDHARARRALARVERRR
jgi:Flp pilus assembly protein TadD